MSVAKANNELHQQIILTPLAITKVSEIRFQEFEKNPSLSKDAGLRLSVKGGGCSGLSYHMDFGLPKEKDVILKFENFDVFIDPKSFIYLKGVTLDFQDGLQGKGFIFQNPNAKNSCGCGESFSV